MKKRDLKMLALLGLTSGLLISQGDLAATENGTFAEQEFLSSLSIEDQQLYQSLDQEGQLLAKLIASPSCGNSCANEWNSRHGSGISYDGACGGKSGCGGNDGGNYGNSGASHNNYHGDSGMRGPGGVKGNSNRSYNNENNSYNRGNNTNNNNRGVRNDQVSLADEPNSYSAGAAPKSGANTRKQGLNDSGKIAGAGDQNRNGVVNNNNRNNNNNVNSNGYNNNNNSNNVNGNGYNSNNNRNIILAANNASSNSYNNANSTRNNNNNNNNNNRNNNGNVSLSEETATTSQRPNSFTASGDATNYKTNTAGKNAKNAGIKSNKTKNHNTTSFEQIPSKQNIDKNLLVSLLNKQGKAQYYRLSPEGQKLALELANQDCKGKNSCEGKNSCSSSLAQGPGLGGPGSSPGPFSDKNLAVRVAAMQEKRIALADN